MIECITKKQKRHLCATILIVFGCLWWLSVIIIGSQIRHHAQQLMSDQFESKSSIEMIKHTIEFHATDMIRQANTIIDLQWIGACSLIIGVLVLMLGRNRNGKSG